MYTDNKNRKLQSHLRQLQLGRYVSTKKKCKMKRPRKKNILIDHISAPSPSKSPNSAARPRDQAAKSKQAHAGANIIKAARADNETIRVYFPRRRQSRAAASHDSNAPSAPRSKPRAAGSSPYPESDKSKNPNETMKAAKTRLDCRTHTASHPRTIPKRTVETNPRASFLIFLLRTDSKAADAERPCSTAALI